MIQQLNFVEMLFKDLKADFQEHIDNKKDHPLANYYTRNYMNKNCGKCALKRKITFLRQELLNLERMLDE